MQLATTEIICASTPLRSGSEFKEKGSWDPDTSGRYPPPPAANIPDRHVPCPGAFYL